MDLFAICVCLCLIAMSFSCSLVVILWERAGLFALLYVMFFCVCHFPMWCPGSDVVLDCTDS